MPTLKDETRPGSRLGREIGTFRPSRDRVFEELRDRVEILADLASAISAIAPSDEVIERAVERLARVFPDHYVTYATIDTESVLRVIHATPPSGAKAEGSKGRFTLAPEYARQLRRGDRVVVHDVFVDSRTVTLADALNASETRAFVCVPLRHSATLMGIFAFGSGEPRVWSKHEIDTLTAVAQFAAVAVTAANERYERMRAENALRLSEQRYRDLVDGSQALICDHDLDGRITAVNPAAAHTLGYEPGELVRMSIAEILTPTIRDRLPQYLARIRETGSDAGVMHVMTRFGEERIWTYRSIKREDPVTPSVLTHCQDITALRRSQERERELETLIRNANPSGRLMVSDDNVARDLKSLIATIRGNAELALVNASGDPNTTSHDGAIVQAAVEATPLTDPVRPLAGKRPHTESPAAATAVRLVDQRPRERMWTTNGTILVVDDEPAIRSLLRATLERHGFDVLSASTGAGGVSTFEEHRDKIRAVLMDLTMPGMGGGEAFAAIHRSSPETPVILVSGFAEQEAIDCLEGAGVSAFLRKPFPPSVLIETLRQLLEPQGQISASAPVRR